MQGRLSQWRGAALYLLACLLLALVAAGALAAAGAGWLYALLFAVPLTLVYAFASGFSAYYLCRAYPLARAGALSILGVFGVSALLAAGLWSVLGAGWNALWQSFGLEWAGIDMRGSLQLMLFGLGVILYGLSAVGHYLAIEFERARGAERRELESQLMAQQAQLRMLRTQIDPHFLFNSLNSISALTSIDPAAAREMTLRLANFFRHSLGLEAHRMVTLEAECALLLDFLAIEQVRFGARLRVEHAIDAAARACVLPPMLLQPLVENAVKHGIGNLIEGGTLRIEARRVGAQLFLSVENDVDDDAPAPRASGIGLANVRARLAAEYGHEASLHCARGARRFRVELTVPAQSEAA
jgi:two-component system sensor histidine kinase AlgZ